MATVGFDDSMDVFLRPEARPQSDYQLGIVQRCIVAPGFHDPRVDQDVWPEPPYFVQLRIDQERNDSVPP